MEPTREQRVTLDEVLNRVLDKGVLIDADIVISVAEIPLLAVRLKAALAGMETMLEYGMMQDMDQACRKRLGQPTTLQGIPLAAGESLAFETLGSLYLAEGIYGAWRHGTFYLTNQRLLLFHQALGKVLFATPLASLREIAIHAGECEELHLYLEPRRVIRVRAAQGRSLAEALASKLPGMGHQVKTPMDVPLLEEAPAGIIEYGETVTHHGRMWMQADGSGAWQAGHLYITTRKLCWWNSFQGKLAFVIPLDKIAAATLEVRGRKKILDVILENGQGRALKTFSGKELAAWQDALAAIVEGGDKMETCPQCGRPDRFFEFPHRGCSECGWVGSEGAQAAS